MNPWLGRGTAASMLLAPHGCSPKRGAGNHVVEVSREQRPGCKHEACTVRAPHHTGFRPFACIGVAESGSSVEKLERGRDLVSSIRLRGLPGTRLCSAIMFPKLRILGAFLLPNRAKLASLLLSRSFPIWSHATP